MIMRLLAAACIALHLAACTTLTPINAGLDRFESLLRVGDEVLLTDRTGKVHPVTVTSLSPEQICHASARIRVADITAVERREISAVKTTFLIVSLVAIVALWAYANALGALMSWQ